MLSTHLPTSICAAGPSRLVQCKLTNGIGVPRRAIGSSRSRQPGRADLHLTTLPRHPFTTLGTVSPNNWVTTSGYLGKPRKAQSCSFSTSPRRPFPPLSNQPPPSHPSRQPAPPPEEPHPRARVDPNAVSVTTDEKSQARTDWRIILKLAENIWPRGSPRTKIRVIGALGLLVGGKVLNVQVPFFFKEIVDAMNVPITSSSTVWVLAGASIAGCTYSPCLPRRVDKGRWPG